MPGKFFAFRRSDGGFPLSTIVRSPRRLAILVVVVLVVVSGTIGAVLFGPAAKTRLQGPAHSAVHQATRIVAPDGITGFPDGHVRRLKEHHSGPAKVMLTGARKGDASARSEDWLEFRGPGQMGHSSATGLPTRWSPTENIAWKTAIPGKGWSSPVTLGDRIFLTTAIPSDKTHELHVLELDAASAEIEWDTTVFASLLPELAQVHEQNSHATPTPLVHGDRVYVHFGPHGTACLTLDGEVLWKSRELVYDSSLGGTGSPALADGVLVISCDGATKQFVVGVDANTGKVRWKVTRHPTTESIRYAFSTPLVIDVGGKKRVVSSGPADANLFDPQTGADIWRVHYGGWATISRPVFGNGMIYLAAGFSRLMAIRPDGHGNVSDSNVAWKQERSIPTTPSPLLVGDSLYLIGNNGVFTCLDAKTGKPRWIHRAGGTFNASPVFAADNVYAQSEDGDTIIFKADPKQYVEVAKNKLNEQCEATPAVIGNASRPRTSLYHIESR